MSEINRVTALTPGSLVALALLSHGGRGVPYPALVKQCQRITALLLRLGARTTPSLTLSGTGRLRQRAIREALKLYVKSGLLEQRIPGEGLTEEGLRKRRKRKVLHHGPDVVFAVPDAKRLRLDLAKNSIIHLLVDRALIAVALTSPSVQSESAEVEQSTVERHAVEQGVVGLESESQSEPPSRRPSVRLDTLRTRVQTLSRLFKYEFMFRADASFEEIFADVLGDMCKLEELQLRDETVTVGPGHDGLPGRKWIAFYVSTLRNFLEAYRIAARSLRLLMRRPLTQKDLSSRALRIGEQMFLEGEIERSEAVSRLVINNALSAFYDQGYLVRDATKVSLATSVRSEPAAKAIEARIAAYLPQRNEE